MKEHTLSVRNINECPDLKLRKCKAFRSEYEHQKPAAALELLKTTVL